MKSAYDRPLNPEKSIRSENRLLKRYGNNAAEKNVLIYKNIYHSIRKYSCSHIYRSALSKSAALFRKHQWYFPIFKCFFLVLYLYLLYYVSFVGLDVLLECAYNELYNGRVYVYDLFLRDGQRKCSCRGVSVHRTISESSASIKTHNNGELLTRNRDRIFCGASKLWQGVVTSMTSACVE